MKLKKIVPLAGNRATEQVPTLTIGRHFQFSLNKSSKDKFKKDTPTRFDFYQDEENEKHWFLHQSKEGSLNFKEVTTKGFTVASSSLGRQIFESLNHNGSCALKFTLGKPLTYEGETMIPLHVIPISLKVNKVEIPKEKPYQFSTSKKFEDRM